MRTRKLSCFVIACNEADRIENCLKPLAGWVDQLIVLDSGSSDGTVAIAQQYATEVYQTDWPGFGAQRNRALAKCDHEWVLNIDADEVITASLKQEIDQVLSSDSLDANLIKIPWHTVLFGETLKYGRYSSPQGKLFLKTGAKFRDRAVHETLEIPDERVMVLSSPLMHYSWRDYNHMQEKHLKYAALIAEQKFKAGRRSSLWVAALRFLTDFIHQFIFRLGFLDGWRGFVMAAVLGQYAFHKYVGLVILQRAKSAQKPEDSASPQ